MKKKITFEIDEELLDYADIYDLDISKTFEKCLKNAIEQRQNKEKPIDEQIRILEMKIKEIHNEIETLELKKLEMLNGDGNERNEYNE